MSADGQDHSGADKAEKLAKSFSPIAVYADWEKDPIWQLFLKRQKKLNRPRTERVNELMYSVPDGTRKEFLRRISRVNKCDNAVDFERHALGVAFAMQRLSLMMTRRKDYMRLSSEPFVIKDNHLSYMAYSDDETPPRARVLIIMDNFTLFRGDDPFIYKAKYTPIRQFGEIDLKNKDPHSDHNQLLKYNEAIEQGLICGAAIEIRGLISPKFLDWACGTSVFERSDIPHVQLIYNMPLPSGAEYRFTFKKASSLAEELVIENDRSQFSPEDLEVIEGINNALESGNQFQLTELMTGQGVFREKGDLTQQFQSFSCPAREEELKEPEYYDNYLNMLRAGIWRRAKNIRPEKYSYEKDTIFCDENSGIEDDYEALKQRVEEFQSQRRAENLKIDSSLFSKDPHSETYKKLLHDTVLVFADSIRRSRAIETARREDEAADPSIVAYRKEAGWVGKENGYSMDMFSIMLDSIDTVMAQHNGGLKKNYDREEGRFMDASDVLNLLSSRKDEQTVSMMVFNPHGRVKRQVQTNPAESEIKKEINKARQENARALAKYFVEADEGKIKLTREERRAYHRKKNEILAVQADMAIVLKEKIETAKSLAPESKKLGVKKLPDDHPLMQRLTVLEDKKAQQETLLIKAFTGILPKTKENQLLRHVHVNERNIIKLVYAIDHEGQMTFDEEKQHAAGRAERASHSELVGGGNVYGAGEIILEKPSGSKKWHVIEINNGSGHYRPPSDTLRFVTNCLMDNLRAAYLAKGLKAGSAEMQMRRMMAQARLTDTIARGITLRDQERDLRKELEVVGDKKNPIIPNASDLTRRTVPSLKRLK